MEGKPDKEEEGVLPRLPAAADTNVVVPPASQHPSRITDNGDDSETMPPHTSLMSPRVDRTAATTITGAAVTLPLLRPTEPLSTTTSILAHVTDAPTAEELTHKMPHPSRKNRSKGKIRSPKMRKNRANRIDRQDDEAVRTSCDDVTFAEEDESSSMVPGAVSVGGLATRYGRPSSPETSGQFFSDSDEIDSRTQVETQIVGFLAPADDDHEIAGRIAQRAEELLRRQMEEGEVIVAAEVKNDDLSRTFCGLKKRALFMLGLLALLLIIGSVVGGVLSSAAASPATSKEVSSVSTPAPTSAPTTMGDALLEELISLLGAIYDDEDGTLFSDPMSPQSQALTWMKNDTILMSPGRSTRDLLQRYVLAVLFYATNGINWTWSRPYLSGADVCSWNKGFGASYGVYCRSDGGSVLELFLPSNSLKGRLPRELVLLSTLEIIQLGGNQLTGTIPSEFGQLLSLEKLFVNPNSLTGTIPTEFGQLLSLGYLDVSSNFFTGTIPTELGQLLSLTTLGIAYNPLTGTIPTELGQLLSLKYLEIREDFLTGMIPTELGQLLALVNVGIDGNWLTGTIPTELGGLLSLGPLDVSRNELSGPIPTELGRLTALKALYIQENQLTGTIPSELAGMDDLTYFDFSVNQLTGSLDQLFCSENRSWDKLYGDCQVECSCCTDCWQ